MAGSNLNSGDFRAALGAFTTGVTIVTTTAPDGADVGLTANSFNSVSLDPPMVLWSIGKNALSQPAFAAAEHFAVHILASDQEDLSNRFAKRGEDKFAGLDLQRGPGNVPLLDGCTARFKCRTAYRYEGGDHDIIVGEVIEFDHLDKKPLLFHRGKYSVLAGTTDHNEFAGSSLAFVLARAHYAAFKPIRDEMQRLNISLDQFFVLAGLGARPMRFEEIQEIGCFYDRCFDSQAVEDLKRRELIEAAPAPAETLRLTESGRRLMLQLLAIGKDAEATMLEPFEPWEGQWLKGALHRIGSATPTVSAERDSASD